MLHDRHKRLNAREFHCADIACQTCCHACKAFRPAQLHGFLRRLDHLPYSPFRALPVATLATGYGAYPPITWPEVLVWIFCMICVATMFAFFNGQL